MNSNTLFWWHTYSSRPHTSEPMATLLQGCPGSNVALLLCVHWQQVDAAAFCRWWHCAVLWRQHLGPVRGASGHSTRHTPHSSPRHTRRRHSSGSWAAPLLVLGAGGCQPATELWVQHWGSRHTRRRSCTLHSVRLGLQQARTIGVQRGSSRRDATAGNPLGSRPDECCLLPRQPCQPETQAAASILAASTAAAAGRCAAGELGVPDSSCLSGDPGGPRLS